MELHGGRMDLFYLLPEELTAMKIVFLPANQRWAFTFGPHINTADLVRMGDGPLFFETRREAVDAALAQGLTLLSIDHD